jgi:hypothetical protein
MRRLLLLAWALLPLLIGASPAYPQAAPAALSAADTSFAAIVTRLSESGGYFDTDNLISNEASYLHVIGGLRQLGLSGGAYLGVGPDQNFSYIAQLRPSIAILVDIRRDNLLEHLLFKALFEISRDRAEYLGLLLARPIPPRRTPDETVQRIIAHFDSAAFSSRILEATRERIHRRLTTYGLELSQVDLATIDRFHAAFARDGLDLRFQSFGRAPQYYYPTHRDLVLERDREGRHASYLASDDAFQFVRRLQLRNRIIPAVGDLAGTEALPAIARFLSERGEPLSAYYTSNVEYYLAQNGTLDAFIANVARFPRARNAVIIRSLFRTPHPQSVEGYASTQLLQPIDILLAQYAAGRIRGYYDLVTIGAVDLR